MRFYRNFYIPFKAHRIRKKKRITVLFPVWNLGMWKSEELYKSMLTHNRFNPKLILGYRIKKEDLSELIEYCDNKKYDYSIGVNHQLDKHLWEPFHPDIIFVMQPYSSEFLYNPKSLFCYVPYCLHNGKTPNDYKTHLLLNCWQIYYENKELIKFYSSLDKGIEHNRYATGIPQMDELKNLRNTKPVVGKKKKIIIYAPHHSITSETWWRTSSFLQTGELMLELAEKYSDKIDWIFKPHPVLRKNLEQIWGKERTDEYYHKWSNSSWSRYENGKYYNLFKESDALIHDCGSFIEEYLATGKPVMFLQGNQEIAYLFNDPTLAAYNLHYHGRNKEQIECFINNVISGIDSLKEDRRNFFEKNLMLPEEQTAADNIIDCILSKDAKKKYR